ncbi:MAG: PaaI family thioesterase [Dehalococcoidia bacterium]|nr:MAG: PaaI family thioesterase [Dehalococcoidia bacterium]UCG82761.1 MAG: PaaI family thioesterase [Dehalococcoidia bacterium]
MPKKIPSDLEGFDPFSDLIGLTFTRCENGFSQCILNVSKKLLNPHKTLHGGVAYSMADTGMGAALYTRMDEDELCATIEMKIVYFKAVTSGTLTCDTKLIHRSKRIAALESEIKQGEQLVAKAMGTFSVFEDKRSSRS